MSTMGIDPFELKQWELDTEIENYHSRNGPRRGYDNFSRATRSTGFDQVDSYEGEPTPRLAQLRELLGYSRHRCATRSTSFDMQDSYNPHWHRGQEGGVGHKSRR